MKVKQFKYASDNLSYLIYSKKSAVAVDAGAVDEITEYASDKGLQIIAVTNTHSHPDHTLGNRAMIEKTGAVFYDCKLIRTLEFIEVDDEKLMIYFTPGHIDDCLTFKAGNSLITGDTLFNGTVGNCFSGDMKSFFESIQFLLTFPEHTLIYAGHDYVRESMAFARTIDPDNPNIDRYLKKYNPDHVVSTIKDELEVNPYVRFNSEDMIAILKQKQPPCGTEYERWLSIMELY